jgi:hypothetical protein
VPKYLFEGANRVPRKEVPMGAISRGFRLARASWAVVVADRQLLWLPILSFLAALAVMAVFALGIVGIGLPESQEDVGLGFYLLAFLLYVALSFVTIFFNAAVIGAATERLEGREASLSVGLGLARAHLAQIFVWAVITATVGMVLRMIQERLGILGRIVGGLLGIAWNAITFFVVPVLLYEPATAPEAVKRSASLFRQRWGEQFTGNVTIGLAIFLVGLAVGLPLTVLAAAAPIVGVPLLVLAIGLIAAAGAACSGVFSAALYRYAVTGEGAGPFSREDLDAAFKPKRGTVDTRPPPPPRPDA